MAVRADQISGVNCCANVDANEPECGVDGSAVEREPSHESMACGIRVTASVAVSVSEPLLRGLVCYVLERVGSLFVRRCDYVMETC